MDSHTHRTIDAVWRIESPRLIAGLVRMVRDVGLAEDLAHEALVAALEQWPGSGVPDNPGAWLMAIGKRRAVDHFRRVTMAERKHEELRRDLEMHTGSSDLDEAIEDDVGDDLLRLMFVACHPVLSKEARVALTLRLLGGLTTEEIARAFLVPEPTVAQRIVRAKRILAEARVSFEVPHGSDRTARLSSVLEVIYLIFNEGYSATAGDDWVRPALCEDALRLGRIVAELAPQEPEVHGLVALMEIQASRLRTRVGPGGEPILLLDQDRSRWDQLLIRRGLAALERAQKLGGALGPYALQAAIAACHARASRGSETDWLRIVALYDALGQIAPSPVVELNRAVAVGMAYGPAAGLEVVEVLTDEQSLNNYHLLPSVRGDLLARLRRFDEARVEFERAASLTRNVRERELLLGALQRASANEHGLSEGHRSEEGGWMNQPKASTKKGTPTKDMDGFLAMVPDETRAALEKLRKTIRAAAPDATETIGYGVPMFKYQGRPLVSFGAGKNHCSFYVMSPEVMRAHAAELKGHDTSAGTIRFQPAKPLPTALVKKLVKARIAEIETGRGAYRAKSGRRK